MGSLQICSFSIIFITPTNIQCSRAAGPAVPDRRSATETGQPARITRSLRSPVTVVTPVRNGWIGEKQKRMARQINAEVEQSAEARQGRQYDVRVISISGDQTASRDPF
ncbi:uncharacterized protein Z518_08544 [Rhinocladiella mackenziei CBS 650.93]|uniref:Uncharacterized protein n=1 Tax=Rhinocladiella mackenziei CBS 650.93 TaxID=1442369 RepID=A0A0D2GWK4_9EURO|nr:uncharacterized protein Z518_08544 [Rhinocladiella mackenziei CBS 650.93]KIX02603.1 hypothetical protein Z518_08544 [Rhinocladiella mackenziei CBS 650.93]